MCFQYTKRCMGQTHFTQGDFKYMATLMDLITFRVTRNVINDRMLRFASLFLFFELKTFVL